MIDLDAYFRRIAYRGPAEPTLDVLTAICAAHPAAIAFENMDPLLGRAPRLAPEVLQAKLVERRRGGYCYEQNALLRLALLELGFRVTSLAARVLWMSPPDAPARQRSHMMLMTETNDAPGRFVVDAGFGGHLFNVALAFEPGLEQRSPASLLRIAETPDGDSPAFTIETRLPHGWAPIYRFRLESQLPIDYEPLNWFTATHPSSMFCHNLLLDRLTAQARSTLFNDRLTVRAPGAAPRMSRIETAAEFERLLDDVFDLQAPIPAAELFERLPKGHEGPYFPPAH